MREHGREPMSMTHGDFDYEYLEALALGPDGKRRFDRLSFAGHFDMLMFGRRGIHRPTGRALAAPVPSAVRRAVRPAAAASTECSPFSPTT